jgi:aflatoxin B1 aldehyde reductase
LQYQGKYEEAEMINRRLKLPAAELAYRWVAFDSPLDPECGDAIVFDASKLSQVKETLA